MIKITGELSQEDLKRLLKEAVAKELGEGHNFDIEDITAVDFYEPNYLTNFSLKFTLKIGI